MLFKARGKNCEFEGDKLFVWTKKTCRLYNTDGTPFCSPHRFIRPEEGYYMGYDEDYKKQWRKQTLIKSNGEEVKLPPYEIGIFKTILQNSVIIKNLGNNENHGTI